ncbi:MAG TPA: ABC transporter permease [Geminicoccus sp.]|jgi:peptide/nickel transport system permease protein|uniref:ABC transporter permease n=1 Tax=Geminicoccus sp. TaxID=2024832 RepID=UPI002E330746|nr:ABC transporter permease [Geminicoccus sp.]HEX2527527.1 ABC transporter permease [Geminicoccus sp.]
MPDLAWLIGKRLLFGVLTLFAVSVLVFAGTELLPGDLAQVILGQSATPETVAAIRAKLNLGDPALVRYWRWLSGILTGDLGNSLASGRPITTVLMPRLGATLFLAATAAVIAVPLAIILGLLSALWRDRTFDKSASAATLAAISMPEFFIGYLLVYVFAVQLGWFPAISRISPSAGFGQKLWAIALPAMTLTLVTTGHMMRMTRAAIVQVLSAPYVEMSELKGTPRKAIIFSHALPNAIGPIANVVVLNLAFLVVGVILVEVVFVYPGMGQLMVDAVAKRDIPLIQACAIVFAITYVVLNMLADIVSILANPRLRHPR